MNHNYQITGFFYELNGRKFRKYLDIKIKSSVLEKPDLMVVMMNPGSSCPVDPADFNIPTIAIPDNTQHQIMKVMRNASFEYARILNLSDMRTPKSDELYEFINSPEAQTIPHSIFFQSRANDYLELFTQNVPIVFGWGVNLALENLAKVALLRINCNQPIGLKKLGFECAYYHPLPPNNKKQKEWVEKISNALLHYNYDS